MRNKNKDKKLITKEPMDFILFITTIILLALGLIMVLSASSPNSLTKEGNSYKLFIKQLQFAIVGIVAMIIISYVNYRHYKGFYKIFYFFSIFILALVLTMNPIKGARRWMFGFQPSELAKILLVLFYAKLLSDNKDKLSEFKNGFLKSLIYIIPIAGLLYFEPHFSAIILIVITISIMMIMAGAKIKHFLWIAISAIPLIYLAIKNEPYRLNRVISFLDPWKYAGKEAWQVIQSLYAIALGGLFGVGLGDSNQKYSYISEPENDFIFAVIAEELGLIGCVVIIVLFMIFLWRGIRIAMKAPDTFGSLVAIGVTSIIIIQVIFNILVVTSSIPVTGISLPFFSYGGTSLLTLLGGVGILLNISRNVDNKKNIGDNNESNYSSSRNCWSY